MSKFALKCRIFGILRRNLDLDIISEQQLYVTEGGIFRICASNVMDFVPNFVPLVTYPGCQKAVMHVHFAVHMTYT